MSTALQKQSHQDLPALNAERTRNRPCFQPRVDIVELPAELTLIADMPGVEQEGIDIRFENGVLTVFGRVADRQPEGTRYLWHEYAHGDYYRSFQVSEVIDSERISAEYANGELTIHLPKVEAARPKRIGVTMK